MNESLRNLLTKLELLELSAYPEFLSIYSSSLVRPTVAFVGEFSAGKTSLVAALLSTDVGVIDVLEATKHPIYFVYGMNPIVYVISENNQKIQAHPINQLEQLTSVHDNTDWILVVLPIEELKQCNVLDTPGTNAMSTFKLNFIPKPTYAFCSPYGEVWTETQMTMIHELEKKVIWIATKADLADEDEIDEYEELYEETIGINEIAAAMKQSISWLRNKEALEEFWSLLILLSSPPEPIDIKRFERPFHRVLKETITMRITTRLLDLTSQTETLFQRYKKAQVEYFCTLVKFEMRLKIASTEWESQLKDYIWMRHSAPNEDIILRTVLSYEKMLEAKYSFALTREEKDIVQQVQEELSILFEAMNNIECLGLVWGRGEQKKLNVQLNHLIQLTEKIESVRQTENNRLMQSQIDDEVKVFREKGLNRLHQLVQLVLNTWGKNEIHHVWVVNQNDDAVKLEVQSSFSEQQQRDKDLKNLTRIEGEVYKIDRDNLYSLCHILNLSTRRKWDLPFDYEIRQEPWESAVKAMQSIERAKNDLIASSKEWEQDQKKAKQILFMMSKGAKEMENLLTNQATHNEKEWSWLEQRVLEKCEEVKRATGEARQDQGISYESNFHFTKTSPSRKDINEQFQRRQWEYSKFYQEFIMFQLIITLPFIYILFRHVSHYTNLFVVCTLAVIGGWWLARSSKRLIQRKHRRREIELLGRNLQGKAYREKL